jgi:uncharacterized protein (DUF58 family)
MTASPPGPSSAPSAPTPSAPSVPNVAGKAASGGAASVVFASAESKIPWTWLGVGLVILGAFARAPGLLLVGALLLLSSLVRTLWSRYGLRSVSYERRLVRDRATLGEPVEMTVTAWNDKILPLAWLEADDLVSDGLVVRERPIQRSDRPGYASLRSSWTLAPFERVTTHLHVSADRRGVYRFGTVHLQVADLFGRDVAVRTEEHPEALLVRPRAVPVRLVTPELAPLGERRTRHGLFPDPALFAGVRPYQSTDAPRTIHWRATARVGQPVSKRFEPATSRRALIALDVQTNEEPYWMMVYDDDLLESLIVAAASLARFILDDGGSVGLAANAWSGSMRRTAFVPPAGGPAQLPTVLDALARLSVFASTPFDVLLGDLVTRLAPGTAVIVVSGHDPTDALPIEARLATSGFPVTHVAFGKGRQRWADAARRAGLPARAAALDRGWRDSEAMELAG